MNAHMIWHCNFTLLRIRVTVGLVRLKDKEVQA